MSIIDKIKSVFIEPDQNAETSKQVDPGKTSSEQEIKMSRPIEVPLESNEKFTEILNKVLESHNQSGFDYLEYKKAVLSIAKLQNMEESAQFKTAFAAAMSMNVQPNHLIDSAKNYVNILETEFTKFNQTAGNFLQSQVTSREAESIQLTQVIKEKEKQLRQLEADLEKHNKRLSEIENEIKTAKTKVETNKTSFKIAYEQLVGQIKEDIRKMEQYLK
jgi:hypothetical protein